MGSRSKQKHLAAVPSAPAHRKLEEIQRDYGTACAQLGELEYRRAAIAADMKGEKLTGIYGQILALNLEADAAATAERAAAAAKAKEQVNG